MGAFQNEFDRLVKDTFCSNTKMKLELLRIILESRGLTLSEVQIQKIVDAWENEPDSDCIDVPDDVLPDPIVLSSEEIDHAIQEFEKRFEKQTERFVESVLEESSPRILSSLHSSLPKTLEEWHRLQSGFEKRLHLRWREGLDRLDMLIIMAHEAGDTFINDLRTEFAGQAVSDETLLFDVLIGLHVRACRTAREIQVLLRAGYADGAFARWRSLHEIAVTSQFVLQYRGDVPRRFLDHAAVDRLRAAMQYQTHCQALGYDPYSDDELDAIREEATEAVTKYGDPFRGDYGWAANALSLPRPTFADIEAKVDLSQWRPFFRLACQSIHASSQGLFFSISAPDEPGPVLLGARAMMALLILATAVRSL